MTQTIKHVVVLMLENRSFDHMFGFMRSKAYPIDGLTGKESNPLDPHQASANIKVSPDADYVLPQDAGHTFPDVNVQRYANPSGPPAAGAQNRGFVFNYAQQPGVGPNGPRIMQCFGEGRLPVIQQLAREFAVCDRWFSSVPGPTWPNRFFAHCATSKGYLDNSIHYYDMPSIFERLAENGQSWNIYFHDFAQSLTLNRLNEEENRQNFLFYSSFAYQAKRGTLPSYAFIEPRYVSGLKPANDQHPPHDMLQGEALIADVYETLRASPAWNETLLLIVYDEHGGTYDHVKPPKATPPDQHTAQFAFDRYGPRVPAVIISPYVPKGAIIHTLFDHTSIAATLRKVFGVPRALTARDAKAATFDGVASLNAPRTDTPLSVRAPLAAMRAGPQRGKPAGKKKAPTRPALQPVSDMQRSLLDLAEALTKSAKGKAKLLAPPPAVIVTERAAALRLQQLAKAHLPAASRRPAVQGKPAARKK
jgi:phospholipase C